MKTIEMNSLALAYLGDSIYEVYIRFYLMKKGICKVHELSEQAKHYVSAKGQASKLQKMIDENILTSDELDVIKRARNHKSHKSPKNTDVITYKQATGFEALIGYLFLENKNDRLNELMSFILEDEICIFMEKMSQ